MRSENWRTAAAEFDRALEEDPDDPALNNNRAWSLLMLGDERLYGEAEAHARRAVSADPENPAYLDTLVRILERIPGKEPAVGLWQKRLDEAQANREGTAETEGGAEEYTGDP
jgi:tetratricopeptide (TPR) repeat protein